MKKLLIIISLFTSVIFCQNKDPEVILENVIKNFDRVKDYQAEINIKVDIEFLKVPESNAKVYFKQPDKVNLESDAFALLPKEGLNFSPASLLKRDHTALYDKEKELDGRTVSVVKIIPLDDEGNLVLSTLWIDQKNNRICKVESTTKTNGTFTIDLKYSDEIKYPLPSQMIFSFNLDKMKIPSSVLGNEENSPNTEKKKKTSNTKGKVILTYTNYIINKGIPDSIFEKKGVK